MTRRAGVLGHPITHSLSPVLHRAAYRSLGLDWSYDAIDVAADQLAGVIAALDDEWVGLSLTMPLKNEVLGLLHERSELVVATGAANTVILERKPGGASSPRLVGENTDVHGIAAAIGESGKSLTQLAQADGEAVILGAGATAASALAALAGAGYDSAEVVLRSLARAQSVQSAAAALGIQVNFHLTGDFVELLPDAAVVISTLPGGAADSFAAVVRDAELVPESVLLDVAYERRPTDLGSAWRAAGGVYVSGERMLLHQAVEQVILFTGQRPSVAAMDEALSAALETRG